MRTTKKGCEDAVVRVRIPAVGRENLGTPGPLIVVMLLATAGTTIPCCYRGVFLSLHAAISYNSLKISIHWRLDIDVHCNKELFITLVRKVTRYATVSREAEAKSLEKERRALLARPIKPTWMTRFEIHDERGLVPCSRGHGSVG